MGCGWFPVRLDGPAQQNLNGDVGARFIAPACRRTVRWAMYLERQQGDNELSEQRTNGSAEQWEQRNDQTKPISHNPH